MRSFTGFYLIQECVPFFHTQIVVNLKPHVDKLDVYKMLIFLINTIDDADIEKYFQKRCVGSHPI